MKCTCPPFPALCDLPGSFHHPFFFKLQLPVTFHSHFVLVSNNFFFVNLNTKQSYLWLSNKNKIKTKN